MNNNQPDWASIAGKFDIWLPQLAPVGEALLDALAARTGERIIDLGSGTGEPALTLARRGGSQLDIVGVDSAAPMAAVAQDKVQAEGLRNIVFRAMPAEALEFPDNSFDCALSRFGVMLFEDPLQGMREVHRVLKSGGRFAIAVWGTPETMRTLWWSHQVFADRVPAELAPPLARVTSLGPPGVLEQLLVDAGFGHLCIDCRSFDYRFDSFDDYWDAVEASDILKQQYQALPAGEHDSIRDEIALFAREFHGEHGLVIPHQYLLATGIKP